MINSNLYPKNKSQDSKVSLSLSLPPSLPPSPTHFSHTPDNVRQYISYLNQVRP